LPFAQFDFTNPTIILVLAFETINKKMKLLAFIILPIIGVSLICCKSNDSFKRVSIPVQKVSKFDGSLKLSDFASQIEIIPLKSESDDFIARINKVLVTKDFIIIIDKVLTKRIYIYDLNGNPHASVSSVGKGPGEYISITDVTIDEVSDAIVLYDNKTQRLIWYDFSGSFIKEHSIPGLVANEIAFSNLNTVIFHCIQSNSLSESGKVFSPGLLSLNLPSDSLTQLKELGLDNSGIGFSPGLYGFGESVLFCSQYSDTIFIINDSIVPHIFLDFEHHKTPQDYYSIKQTDINVTKGAGFVTGKHLFCMEGGTMFFGYTIGTTMYYCIANKGHCYFGNWFENDLFPLNLTVPMFIKSGYLYCITTEDEMNSFRNVIESDSIQNESKAHMLKYLVNKSIAKLQGPHNDNPYILRITLK
jgi:hypothetical protein